MAEAPGDQNLLFITYTDAQDGRTHDSNTRKLVRKRALDASRTKDATGKIKIRQPPASRASVPLKQSLGRFRLRKEPESKPKESTEKDDIPAALSVFEPMIGSLGDDSWTLLRYCTPLYSHLLNVEILINFVKITIDFDKIQSLSMSTAIGLHLPGQIRLQVMRNWLSLPARWTGMSIGLNRHSPLSTRVRLSS